jgi:glycosyltransferase involved in cell wall biosynthesis
MKLLRTIRSANPAMGGPIEGIRQSSAALRAAGHEVQLVSLDSPDDSWVRDFPGGLTALGTTAHGYGYSARYVPWLREHAREFDAVLVHGLWQYTSFGAWRALAGGATPYFVFPHGMLDPWFKRTYPLKHVKKLCYWPWAEYRVLRDAAAVLFTSEEERRAARESFALYKCNEQVVNYGTSGPPVELGGAREEFLQRFPELRGKRVLLFLSRLHVKKGCDLLLDAFARLPDESLHLVMAGPCADETYLAQLKQRADEQRVSFTGMLSGNLKWGAFAADAFVLPSHQENFGIAVAEALACGTPVLVSDKVNIWREIVQDGAGFAENDDVAGIHRLLTRWLALDAAAADEMRLAARRSFAERFEIGRAVRSLLETITRHL